MYRNETGRNPGLTAARWFPAGLVILGLLLLGGCRQGSDSVSSTSSSQPDSTATESTPQSDLSASGGELPSETTLPPPKLAASGSLVILLYEWKSRPGSGKALDVAIWGDGRIVWRSDGRMREARIETQHIDDLLQHIHNEAVFGDGDVKYQNWGPDSGYDAISVRLPDRKLRLESWHEQFEQNPNLVVTARGVESLNGRDRDEVLALQPESYRRFRRIWSEIRNSVRSWIPRDGTPFSGRNPLADE